MCVYRLEEDYHTDGCGSLLDRKNEPSEASWSEPPGDLIEVNSTTAPITLPRNAATETPSPKGKTHPGPRLAGAFRRAIVLATITLLRIVEKSDGNPACQGHTGQRDGPRHLHKAAGVSLVASWSAMRHRTARDRAATPFLSPLITPKAAHPSPPPNYPLETALRVILPRQTTSGAQALVHKRVSS